jgi:hypothetical protein
MRTERNRAPCAAAWVITYSWRENLIRLVVILAAGMFAVSTVQAQTLNAPEHVRWGDWGIIIGEFKFTDSVTRFNEKKTAGSSAIFVYLELWVTNHSHSRCQLHPSKYSENNRGRQ